MVAAEEHSFFSKSEAQVVGNVARSFDGLKCPTGSADSVALEHLPFGNMIGVGPFFVVARPGGRCFRRFCVGSWWLC